MLAWAPYLTLLLVLGPVVAGLAWTLLPAFDHLPAIGRDGFGLAPWRELLATPGLSRSVALTLASGFGATALSLAGTIGVLALAASWPRLRRFAQALAPLLAVPHAAMAIGFAFLILPSGWIVRILSPELTGWTQPPAWTSVRDPLGLSLIAGLALKEIPYLLLASLAALNQIPQDRSMAVARGLGYAPAKAWLVAVFPPLYRQIRLPVYAVLVFSLSVVDVALVLAPGTPPPLAVLALRWFADHDVALYPRAAAASILALLLAIAGIIVWRVLEIAVAVLGRRWIASGRRRSAASAALPFAALAGSVAVGCAWASLAGLVLWSIAGPWPFPDALPAALWLSAWTRAGADLARNAAATLAIAAIAAVVATVLVLACLENAARRGTHGAAMPAWLVHLPLLVPQIAFVFGLQVLLVRLGLDGTLAAVAWAHLVFVLPYVLLSLADPWRALDRRYSRAAAALGASPARVFLAVKLPILLRPVLTAMAVGVAVSVAQYLPTMAAGAGRVATLTTEAVTLSSGAERRILGAHAVLQAALPLACFALALLVPALVHRGRRGLA